MPGLFEPLRIGEVEIRNRIVMSPMISNLASPAGYPTDEHIMYLSERTGAGLILTEYTYVNRTDSRGSLNELGLYDDELIPKFRRLTEVIHALGSKIFVQLVHVGRKTRREVIWGNTPLCPSPSPLMDQVKEMTQEDVKKVVSDFAGAARRAERAGFDGVELHGAHGYLIAQFLSPALNKRGDKYGDGVAFLEEVLDSVRAATDIPVGLRISVTEFDESGLAPETVAKIVKRVESKLDYLHLSAGRDGPLGSSMPFYYRRPSFIEEASIVRRQVRLPLLLVGSVITRRDAEEVLKVADAVVVGRQMLADPQWPEKIRSQKPFRPCIRCNQSCRGLVYREVRCDVNPRLGWEILPPPPPGRGEVTVVGGGVMGMEAALVLAERGFQVELVEKGERLGGQLLQLMDPWKVQEFKALLDYYAEELERLSVLVKKGKEWEGHGDRVLLAVPTETQPPFQEIKGKRILVDSNLYAYQDYTFRWAKDNEVFITLRSLQELDPARRYLLTQRYSEVGVKIVEKPIEAEVKFQDFRRDQPSIGSSVRRGYWIARNFMARN